MKKPPSTKRIQFKTKDGVPHNGFYLKNANQFVRNVNRWKDIDTDKWYDDEEVVEWS